LRERNLLFKVKPLPEFLSGTEKFTLTASDIKSGLKSLKATLYQKGREVVVFEKNFPSGGLFFRKGLHNFESGLSIDLKEFKLDQGGIDLQVHIWDCSKRNAGEGNRSIFQHRMVVGTVPPSIRPVSSLHYVNVGGAGLVV